MSKPDDDAGLGSPGLEGYLYQIDASIWAALEFLLVKRQATRVVLEPPGFDDIEAPLKDEEIGPVAAGATVANVQLVIQAKLRNSGPWQVKTLKGLVEHGKRRESAAARLLREPNTHYLLITSADLEGVARRISINTLRATGWPSRLPPTLAAAMPTAAGRFAVLPTQDTFKLSAHLERLLEQSFRVPRSRSTACLASLRETATDRVRGGSGGIWTREEIAASLKAFGGRLAKSAERESFVPPLNWGDIRRSMETQHAVILVGNAGTGKSVSSRVLAEELSDTSGNLTIVNIDRGPDQVRFDQTPEPVVFVIDDPWGHYRFNPGARPWNDELGRLLETADAGRRFIITSRTDVMRESGAKALSARWYQQLETEHYGPAQQLKLFENRLPQLSDELAVLADVHRREVLRELHSPLEIQKFFDALSEGPRDDEAAHALIRRCISAAHESAIENTVIQQVQARDALPVATIVWGLLKARPKISTETLDLIDAYLGEHHRELEDVLSPFISFMVAARHIRQDETWLSYYHNRIEKALETAIAPKKSQTARLMGALVDALIALDGASGDDWGKETATLLIRAVREDSPLQIRISEDAQAALDPWLDAGLKTEGREFRRRLRMAAVAGTSYVAGLARWLLSRWVSTGDMFLRHWTPDPDDPAWYAAHAGNPATIDVCERFIRYVLPEEHDEYRPDFLHRLKRFSFNATPAFLDAAQEIAGDGVNWNSEVIASGALEDLDGFERVAEVAVQVLDSWEADGVTELAILNGEYNDEAADHFWESRSEDGHTAGELLTAYVAALRRDRGWQAIAESRLVDGLTFYWISELSAADAAPGDDELIRLAQASKAANQEAYFWRMAKSHWDERLATILLSRLEDQFGDLPIASALVECAAAHQLPALAQRFSAWAQTDPARLIMASVALAGPDDNAVKDVGAETTVSSHLTSPLGVIVAPVVAALLAGVEPDPSLAPPTLQWLQSVDLAAYPAARLALAQQIVWAGGNPDVQLAGLLDQASGDMRADRDAAVWAAHQLSGKEPPPWPALLSHRFADVRRMALERLAPAAGPLPPELLLMVSDKSHAVRQTLLDLIAAHPDSNATPILLRLIDDGWSSAARSYGDAADYPLARRAAELLGMGPPPPLDAIGVLAGRARATDDVGLRKECLATLARAFGEAGRQRLVDMVRDRTHFPLGKAAAFALLSVDVEPELLSSISGTELASRRQEVAVETALLVGRSAAREHMLAVGETLCGLPSRQGLVLPLSIGAQGRSDEAFDDLLPLLPSTLQTALRARSKDGAKLPRSAIPGTDPRFTAEIAKRLSLLFEEPSEPKKRNPAKVLFNHKARKASP